MQTISKLTVFNGVIPNKAAQTDTEFANNIFGFLNYSGVPFVADINTIVSQLNILSDQINIAATQTATNATNAVNATAVLAAGSVDDVVISGIKAYSNQKVNNLFLTYENKKGSNLPSAATTTIGTAGLGDMIHITGTTTITSLGLSINGVTRTIVFDAVLTLTHNNTSLILPTNANITTAAADTAVFICENGTNGYWKCIAYTRANGTPLTLGLLNTGGNSATATTLIGDQSSWASYRTNAVANMLGWKKYGNDHVIFDASDSTSPSGTAVNNANPQNSWDPNHPTLMGWNGSQTYGVRVDTARYAENGVTASSNATNGYVKLGNGLIIQWGTYGTYGPSVSSTATTVNFPISFPNSCFNVSKTVLSSFNASTPAIYFTVSSFNTTGFTSPNPTQGWMWIAIGN